MLCCTGLLNDINNFERYYNLIRRHIFCHFLLLCFPVHVLFAGGSLKKAYKSLQESDYFLARKTFYSIVKKKDDPYAYYGLSIIFSRNDNPFFNSDSAAKYANRSFSAFRKKPVVAEFFGFRIESDAILALCDSIASRQFKIISKKPTVPQLNYFLSIHYLAPEGLLFKAVNQRDDLEMNHVISKSQSDTTLLFILSHPQSSFLEEAKLLYQRQLFDEFTKSGKANAYKKFISLYPSNIMIKDAYENLFRIYRDQNDLNGLSDFVKLYPNAPQVNEAWKLLFSLAVKNFSNKELEKFLKEYPEFPFRNSIKKELELNKLVLFPCEDDELYGYIDTSGKYIIKPLYDAAGNFSEGLAVVNRNDSVYFINKENKNPFNEYFSDAYEFKNGIAAVKKNLKWFFINRQGQINSKFFEEINELSWGVYVVKQSGKYGAANQLGQIIIEPRFQKLGDFVNDYAYYTENGKYGFVSKSGTVQKAVYDWISDISDGTAIVKLGGQYGIINSYGYNVLEPEFDLILRGNAGTFVVVKNGLYGFYSNAGCFLTQISFDFQKEKSADYYTNGAAFRLIKKNSQTLMDSNGKMFSDFDIYEEINFVSNGLMRIKKNKKYGYADRKLSIVIPFKYQQARDFIDSTAIVQLKDKNIVINISGKEIFSTEEKLEKISRRFFLEGEDEEYSIINNKGQRIVSNVKKLQRIDRRTFILTLDNGEIKLLGE
jgi:hypothetical protein